MPDLDQFQKQAVYIQEGPILVCAGPGSGKTKILVERILYLLKQGIKSQNILAVTFTNKAASEMRERIANLVTVNRKQETVKDSNIKSIRSKDYVPQLPFIGTIHSLCLDILKKESEKSFLVIDDQDQLEIVKRLRTKLKFSTKETLSMLNNFKCKKTNKLPKGLEELYKNYQKYLKDSNLLDFEDVLLEVLNLFNKNDKIRRKYRQQFRYLLVDEYQDINDVQNEIIKVLAEPQNNLFVIGDADQSIYSFRGADVRMFLEFQKEFPDAQAIKLEKNYRSTPAIVRSSLSLIEHNKERIPIKIASVLEEERPLKIVKCANSQDEAKYIVSEIEKIIGGTALLHIDCGILDQKEDASEYEFSDFAVLYRKNSFVRYLEDEFLHRGVPYQIVGTDSFWELEEIRDILNLLKYYATGNTTFAKNLTKKIGKHLTRLDAKCTYEIKDILERSSILDVYEDDAEAISNIEKLISIVQEQKYTTWEELVSKLSLTSRETYIDKRASCVKLTTLHQAKGLEFENVFIAGVEEGFIPLVKNDNLDRELEEERRLFYVGMTRAKERLYLTYSLSRQIWGRKEKRKASRFLGEIDKNNIIEHEFIIHRKRKDQMKLF